MRKNRKPYAESGNPNLKKLELGDQLGEVQAQERKIRRFADSVAKTGRPAPDARGCARPSGGR